MLNTYSFLIFLYRKVNAIGHLPTSKMIFVKPHTLLAAPL
jgi:hypothetical protein